MLCFFPLSKSVSAGTPLDDRFYRGYLRRAGAYWLRGDTMFIQLPPTDQKAAMNTPPQVNAKIRARMLADIAQADADGAYSKAIRDLSRRWDTERVLETNAALLILAGTLLALCHKKGWLIVPAAVSAFLLQHALQGFCPPLPLVRRLGVRSAAELAATRTALKFLRGDFQTPVSDNPELALAIAERG